MLKDLQKLIFEFLQKKILSPFSNKVTKCLLYTGMAIVATPLIEHLVISVLFKRIFGIDLNISVPDTKAYTAGCILMTLGMLHNIAIEYFQHKTYMKELSEKEILPFLQTAWKYIQELYNILVIFPDRYQITKPTQSDINLLDSATTIFSKFEKYFFENKPFQDQKLIKELNELLSMMQTEIMYFRGLLEKRNAQELLSDYNHIEARNEAKTNIASILRQIQEMEYLFRVHIN